MAKRYQSAMLNVPAGGTAAAPVIQGIDVVTNFESVVRTVVGIYVAGGILGLRARVTNASAPITDIDTSVFSATRGPLPLDSVYPVGQVFHIDFYNYNAGAQNNVVAVFEFDV